MCGRYDLARTPEALRRLFKFSNRPNFPPRYNIAPTQDAAVVRITENGARELAFLRWGLVPFGSKDTSIGTRLINAQAETIATTPALRPSFERRRCLVAATGFFEWKAVARLRHPYRIAMKGGAPFALAGLWERWQPGGGPVIETFAIITTTANAIVAPIHDRMPAIIDRADYDAWLESTDVTTARALLHPFAAENMSAHPVSTRVNNPQNDDPGCIAPE